MGSPSHTDAALLLLFRFAAHTPSPPRLVRAVWLCYEAVAIAACDAKALSLAHSCVQVRPDPHAAGPEVAVPLGSPFPPSPPLPRRRR